MNDTPEDGANDIPEGYRELPPDNNFVHLGSPAAGERAEAEIARLAVLSKLQYERVRKNEAKRLMVRTSVLDKEVKEARPHCDHEDDLGLFEPEPWSEEVDGDDLLDQIRQGILRHVVMSQTQAIIVALWTVHTHAFDCWRYTPRLGITAPEKGCGKSTLLDVLKELTPRAIKTENLSTATMFRIVDGYRPILLIDEFDTFLKGNEELRGALNAGHAKGGRHLRCEGEYNQVRAFKTFAPAALAGIGNLPPTLADRSIPVLLQKRRQDETLEELSDHHVGHLNDLASQITRWVADNRQNLLTIKPELPVGIFNRDADNVRPLLTIAEVAGGDWPGQAREAVFAVMSDVGDDAESIGVRLLADMRTVFEQTGHDKLPSKILTQHLHEFEDRPWAEYGRKEQPISPSQLARLLRRYGITPGSIRWGEETPKGYQLSAFKDAFARYLPRQNATTPQSAEISEKLAISKRHSNTSVAAEKSPKPVLTNGCGVVAARTPGITQEHQLSDIERARMATLEDDPEERAAIKSDGMDIPEFLKRPFL
jgi:putative DNA primase/helicase